MGRMSGLWVGVGAFVNFVLYVLLLQYRLPGKDINILDPLAGIKLFNPDNYSAPGRRLLLAFVFSNIVFGYVLYQFVLGQ